MVLEDKKVFLEVGPSSAAIVGRKVFKMNEWGSVKMGIEN